MMVKLRDRAIRRKEPHVVGAFVIFLLSIAKDGRTQFLDVPGFDDEMLLQQIGREFEMLQEQLAAGMKVAEEDLPEWVAVGRQGKQLCVFRVDFTGNLC